MEEVDGDWELELFYSLLTSSATSLATLLGLGSGRIRTPEAVRGSGVSATPAGVGDSFGMGDPGSLRTPG
jgi:hypothetical protein